jgi:hypothetical protein
MTDGNARICRFECVARAHKYALVCISQAMSAIGNSALQFKIAGATNA